MKETRVQFLGWEGPQEKEMMTKVGFPGGSDGRESTCSAGDPGSIPGLGRYPEGGNGNPLQYSCLNNFMDRGAWQAIGSQRVGQD